MKKVYWLLVLIFCAAEAAHAEAIRGDVVKVADGDTITVLTLGNNKVRVRLSGIDAPEKKQPYGKKSKQLLTDLVAGKTVTINYEKPDRYGRLIGIVLLDGQDINLEIIKSGLAWHYKKYQKEQTPENRILYSEGEKTAQAAGINLWSDKNPVPPWEWRKKQK